MLNPWAGRLDLGAKRDQHFIGAETRRDMHADRKPVRRQVQRQRGGRLARRIEHGAEGGIGEDAAWSCRKFT